MKHLNIKELNNDLLKIAYEQLIYYDKLFLYNDNNNFKLIPNSLGGLKSIGYINKEDLYTKEYFKKRKKYFFDKYKNFKPFQKANLFGKKAYEICHNIKLNQLEKLFNYGLKFYDGYNAAYNDFINEPLKWLNLNRVKKTLRLLEKANIFDSEYEFNFAWNQFYIDLKKYIKNKEKN